MDEEGSGNTGAPEKPVRRRNSAITRARILSVATREFARKGFAEAGTDEIADRARINKRMIYHYFSSKEQLYLVVLETAYARARSAEAKLELDSLEPFDALRRLTEFTYDSFVKDRSFISLLATENRQKAKVLRKSSQISQMNSPIIGAIARILERGAESGVMRSGLDPRQLWISLIGVSYFFFSNIHTLSVIFETDLDRPDVIAERREHVIAFTMNAVRP